MRGEKRYTVDGLKRSVVVATTAGAALAGAVAMIGLGSAQELGAYALRALAGAVMALVPVWAALVIRDDKRADVACGLSAWGVAAAFEIVFIVLDGGTGLGSILLGALFVGFFKTMAVIFLVATPISRARTARRDANVMSHAKVLRGLATRGIVLGVLALVVFDGDGATGWLRRGAALLLFVVGVAGYALVARRTARIHRIAELARAGSNDYRMVPRTEVLAVDLAGYDSHPDGADSAVVALRPGQATQPDWGGQEALFLLASEASPTVAEAPARDAVAAGS